MARGKPVRDDETARKARRDSKATAAFGQTREAGKNTATKQDCRGPTVREVAGSRRERWITYRLPYGARIHRHGSFHRQLGPRDDESDGKAAEGAGKG